MHGVNVEFLASRKRLQRRSVRYAILSALLTMILLVGAGCTIVDPGASLSG